jgi:transcriptional regulator with XRE-family HTH domain
MDIGFVTRMKILKATLNKTLTEISDEIGLSISYLSEIFSGKKPPNFEFFQMMVEKYHVSIDWIFTGNGDIFLDPKLMPDFDEKLNAEKELVTELITGIFKDKALFNEVIFRLRYPK